MICAGVDDEQFDSDARSSTVCEKEWLDETHRRYTPALQANRIVWVWLINYRRSQFNRRLAVHNACMWGAEGVPGAKRRTPCSCYMRPVAQCFLCLWHS